MRLRLQATAQATIQVVPGDQLWTLYLRRDPQAFEEITYLDWSDRSDRSVHIVASEGGKLVADCVLFKNPNDAEMWWLQFIATRKGYENRGYAAKIMRRVFEFVSTSERKKLQFSFFSDAGLQRIYPLSEKLRREFPTVEVLYDPHDVSEGKLYNVAV